jgi:3-isopropylmalate dehydrogenase
VCPARGKGFSACTSPFTAVPPRRAGQDLANPIAIILSVAMMLRYSCGLGKEASVIEKAVEDVLSEGYRTYDIMAEGKTRVGTKQMGDLITGKVKG